MFEKVIRHGKVYEIVYIPAKQSPRFADINSAYVCSCGSKRWLALRKTGLGKLKGEIKFKCVECGKWFIAKEENVEASLGGEI